MKPDDKPKKTKGTIENPKLFIVIGEEAFPRPGLETAFIDYSDIKPESEEMDSITTGITVESAIRTQTSTRCLCFYVTKEICVCNKMRQQICNCHGYVKPVEKTETIKVCTCQSVCTCQRHVTGCRCAPVH